MHLLLEHTANCKYARHITTINARYDGWQGCGMDDVAFLNNQSININQAVEISKSCIDACLACVVTCERCITDCVASGHKECILLCRDCADVCALCVRFEARGSRFGKSLHALCAEVCHACSIECSKHAAHQESCRECAEACKECAAICGELAKA